MAHPKHEFIFWIQRRKHAYRSWVKQIVEDYENMVWGLKHNITMSWRSFCNIPSDLWECICWVCAGIWAFISECWGRSIDSIVGAFWWSIRHIKTLFLGKPSFDEVLYDEKNELILLPPQPRDGRVVIVELGKYDCWVIQSKHFVEDWAGVIPSRHNRVKKIILEFSAKDGEWRTKSLDGRQNKYFNPERAGEDACYLDRLGI